MRNLALGLVFLGSAGCGLLDPAQMPQARDGGAPVAAGPRLRVITVQMGGISAQLQTLWDSQAREFCTISAPINGMVYCQSAEGIIAGRPLSAYASAVVPAQN